MNTNFKVIGLTQLGIKPKSSALEADALTTRLSEQFIGCLFIAISLYRNIGLILAICY